MSAHGHGSGSPASASSGHGSGAAAPASSGEGWATSTIISITTSAAGAGSTNPAKTGHGQGHGGGGGGGHGNGNTRTADWWYAVLGLLCLATIINAGYLVWAAYRRRRRQSAKAEGSKPQGRIALRRLPQAVLSGSRIVGFRLRIPYVEMTMLELGLTMAYVGGCLVWVFAPTVGQAAGQNLKPPSWGSTSGSIAAAQLPLSVVLALKNNPITWLTGLGHEKLVLSHRIVSRNILLHSWLHFVGMYYKEPTNLLTDGWKIAGLVGAVAQTLTTLMGIRQFRHRYYEIFYSSHVLLILIFLITVHIHCIPKRADVWVWPVWVLWGFDRLVRWCRYLLFNVILRPKDPKALVQWIGADGLRATVKRRIPGGWKAGQHVFLAFPALGIESHPFTIGNIYEKEEGGDEADMVFIIRAMGGQTKMLLDRAMPSGTCELRALFDGPYGHPEDIRPFSTCVFIAGGTGVTYTVARMHQLFKDIHASAACATRVAFVWAVRTETEYEWVASDISRVVALAPPSVSLTVEIFLTGARRNAAADALPTLEKEYDVEKGVVSSTISSSASRTSDINEKCSNDKVEEDRATQPQSSGASTPTKTDGAFFGDDGTSTPTTPGASSMLRPGMTLRYGRPDLYKILEEEVTASEGAVAVDVSGPNGLVDSVRSALSKPFTGPLATLKGTPTVLLSVEQFRM
ncbi:hypothetical protein OH77DRAFT_1552919 [Trametes cingulata]|nr:hypothetical protein OH77DRAFT_1552919 [Trametes cingulata]